MEQDMLVQLTSMCKWHETEIVLLWKTNTGVVYDLSNSITADDHRSG